MDFLEIRAAPAAQSAPIEIVERKGRGHPDTLADGLGEAISNAYSRYCLKRFGAVLHHNVDKTAIFGGMFQSDFAVCRMEQPIRVLFTGRMSTSFGGEPIDIRALQEQVATEYLSRMLPHLEARQHLRFEHYTTDFSRHPTWFRPRSLEDLPEHGAPTASDTTVVTGYWPFTPVERLVLHLEHYLNDPQRGPLHPYLGQDIKVMAIRSGDEVEVTLAVPFISGLTTDAETYWERLAALERELRAQAMAVLPASLRLRFAVNPSRSNPFGRKRFYLLGLGSCIECGEEGLVGRGNAASGFIAVNRPHTMEAPFGKNPTYHAGKVYTYLAQRMAREIATALDCEVTVQAITRHSEPLFSPHKLIVRLSRPRAEEAIVRRIVEEFLVRGDHVSQIVDGGALMPV